LPPATRATMPTAKSVSPASFKPPPMASTRFPAALMNVRGPQSAIAPLGWTQLPGGAVYAAASPDGSLWALSNQGSGPDRSIWHYVNGTWINIPGAATRLAVAPDNTLWAVNSAGGIYFWNGSAWSMIAGGAIDITVGSDGSPYAVSNVPGGPYGNGIWHLVNGTWIQLPGAGLQIAASWDAGTNPGGIGPGGFYVANAQQSIWYYDPALGYHQLPGSASQLAPTRNGGLFALGLPAIQNGYPIYYNDLSVGSWSQQPGAAVAIATDGVQVYAVGASGGIYAAAVSTNADVPTIEEAFPDSNELVPQRLTFRRDFGTFASTSQVLNVPWMSQATGGCNVWQQPPAGQPRIPDSQITASCGPASASMAWAYIKGRAPTEIFETFVRRASGNWPCGLATTLGKLESVLNDLGVKARKHPFDAASLLSAMQLGHPVIAYVIPQSTKTNDLNFSATTGHYMLVIGVIAADSGTVAKVVVNDPGRGGSKYADHRAFPLDEFVKAWTSKSSTLEGVEVGADPVASQTGSGDFFLVASPASLTITRGAKATFPISVQSIAGFNSQVYLSVTGLPQDQRLLGTGFAPKNIAPAADAAGNATLQIVTDSSTPTGSYSITIQGASGSLMHQASVSLTVTASDNVAPNTVTGAANNFGPTSVRLTGAANPNGAATWVQFEWGTSSSYGNSTSAQTIGSGSTSTVFSQDLFGLTPNTTYHYRAVATNSIGTTVGTDIPFTTSTAGASATPPTASTSLASSIGQTSSMLNGTATPNGSATNVFFQWGATTAYGSVTPSQPVGNGTSAVNASAVLDGLSPNTTYHYRLVAVNNVATTSGNDVSFATSAGGAAPPPSIGSVSPNPVTGSNSQKTITINGANFMNKPSVTLTWSGQPGYTVPASQLSFISSTQVLMTITTTTAPDNWTARVTNPDGQSSSAAGFAVISPNVSPSIGSVGPNPVTGSNSQQTITINGTNFANKPTLTLTWSGQPGYTVPSAQVTFVSSTQVQMAITTTTAPDNWTVTVTNPDGQSSSAAAFSVVAPSAAAAPTISSVTPNPVTGSNSQQTITINGANFVNKPALTLTWSGQSGYTVPTGQVTYISSTQLQMAITTTTAPDNWSVRVTNPNGQYSNAAGFTVAAPSAAAPSISSVSPNPVTGSNSQQTITVNGANFVNKPALTLTWTGQAGYTVPTGQVTYVSSTQVQMAINTTTSSDNWTVKVTNPDGQSSSAAGFTVVAPTAAAPSISSVSPNPVTGSNSQQTITVNGANFVNKPALTLTWTGQAGYTVPTGQVTYVSSTQVQMAINTTTSPDNWTVKVTNPDGQSSSASGFTVVAPSAPAPTITSVSPNPVTGSNSQQTITINGANYVNKPTLTLTWTGQAGYTVPTGQVTYVSTTQVKMAINTTTSPDNWTVKVTNPDGKSSSAAAFTVKAP
jgi:hypothetical protein